MPWLLRKISTAPLILAAVLGNCSVSAAEANVVAFVDVNVIQMTKDEFRPHQTVLVQGERIVAIGPSDAIRVPEGATRIAGATKYLMPGLIDMHVHFRRLPSDLDYEYSKFPDFRERNDDAGVLFVANGVTSVRQMHGHPAGDELVVRSRGDWVGPTVYSTGPITDGNPPVHKFARVVTTPEEALQAVLEDKAKGYVGVKVYDGLTAQAYQSIMSAAEAARIDVVGHVPDAIGLEGAIASHQSTIEHADSFLPSVQPGPYTIHSSDNSRDLYQRVDQTKLDDFADELRRSKIWTCPTIVVTLFDSADYEHSPEVKYVPAAFRAALHKHWTAEPFEEEHAFALLVARRLHERGAGLLLGTDSYLVVPGFSAIQELGFFADAGLSPFEALQTGTVNAALALHEQDAVGTVDVGRRADLLLLEGNPLIELSNIRRLAGVMLRGRWFSKSELERRLAMVASNVAVDVPRQKTSP